MLLGQLYERKQDGQRALAAYGDYFKYASENHPMRASATARMANLKEVLGIKP